MSLQFSLVFCRCLCFFSFNNNKSRSERIEYRKRVDDKKRWCRKYWKKNSRWTQKHSTTSLSHWFLSCFTEGINACLERWEQQHLHGKGNWWDEKECVYRNRCMSSLCLLIEWRREQVSSVLYQSSFATDATKEVVREEKSETTKVKREEAWLTWEENSEASVEFLSCTLSLSLPLAVKRMPIDRWWYGLRDRNFCHHREGDSSPVSKKGQHSFSNMYLQQTLCFFSHAKQQHPHSLWLQFPGGKNKRMRYVLKIRHKKRAGEKKWEGNDHSSCIQRRGSSHWTHALNWDGTQERKRERKRDNDSKRDGARNEWSSSDTSSSSLWSKTISSHKFSRGKLPFVSLSSSFIPLLSLVLCSQWSDEIRDWGEREYSTARLICLFSEKRFWCLIKGHEWSGGRERAARASCFCRWNRPQKMGSGSLYMKLLYKWIKRPTYEP